MPFDPNTARPLGEAARPAAQNPLNRPTFDAASALPEALSVLRRPQSAAPADSGRGIGGAIKDTALSLGQGAISANMGIGQIANLATGGLVDKVYRPLTAAVDTAVNQFVPGYEDTPGVGRSLAESSQDAQAVLGEGKSPQLRAKIDDLNQTDGFFPTIGKLARNPSLLVDQTAQQIPQFLAPAGAARKVGETVLERVATQAFEQGVAKRVAQGVAPEVAAKLARPAAERLGERAASKASARAVQVTGGLIGGAQAGEQAQQAVLALPQETFDANPEYRDMIAKGTSDADARQQLAVSAGMKAAAIAAPFDTLTAGISSKLEAGIFRGKTGTEGAALLTRPGLAGVAKATGKEFTEETLQEGGEQVAQNIGVQGVDPTQDLSAGVAQQAAVGGVIGGLMGGGGFVASSIGSQKKAGPLERAAANAPVQQTIATTAAPGTQQPIAGTPQGGIVPPGSAGTVMPIANAPSAFAAMDALRNEKDGRGPPPIPAPTWIDEQTGQLRQPAQEELNAAMAQHFQDQIAQGKSLRISTPAFATAWNATQTQVKAARADALRGINAAGGAVDAKTVQSADRAVQQEQDQAALEKAIRGKPVTQAEQDSAALAQLDSTLGTGNAGQNTADGGVPTMITSAMKRELKARGIGDDAIAKLTPQEAFKTIKAADRATTTDTTNAPATLDQQPAAIPDGADGTRAIEANPTAVDAGTGRGTDAVAGDAAATIEPATTPPGPTAEQRDQRLSELLAQRKAGDTLTPDASNELVDLLHSDRAQARVAGNGAPINGVRNIKALSEQETDGTAPSGGRIFADGDNFKRINDQLGHSAGDSVIKAVGEELGKALPNQVFHRGGDEFVITPTDEASGRAGMEKARAALAQLQIIGVDAAGNEQTQNGIGVSYGYGKDAAAAETDQYADKERRAKAGLRTDRTGPETANRRADAGNLDQAGVQARVDQSAPAGRPGLQDAGQEVAAEPTPLSSPPVASLSDNLPTLSPANPPNPSTPSKTAAPSNPKTQIRDALIARLEERQRNKTITKPQAKELDRLRGKRDTENAPAPEPTAGQLQQARDPEVVTQELDARAADLHPKVDALSVDEARAGAEAIGEKRPADLRDPWAAIKRNHPEDVATALDAAAKFRTEQDAKIPAGETRQFYVTIARGTRVGKLAGPFQTKAEADAMVSKAKTVAEEIDDRSSFDAFGVTAITAAEHTPGKLNERLGLAAPVSVDAAASSDTSLPHQLLAKPSGYPVGGFHATDAQGEVLHRGVASAAGEAAPRFPTAEKADAFARKELARREKVAAREVATVKKSPVVAKPDAAPVVNQKVMAAPAESTAPEANTEDAGAELWYNRRNRSGNGVQWSDIEGLNETLRVKEATKSKVWPRPDYAALVEDGLQPVFAHLVKQVYDAVAAKPAVGRRIPSNTDIQQYVETVNAIRTTLFDWVRDSSKTGAALSKAIGQADLMRRGGPMSFSSVMGKGDTVLLDAAFPTSAGSNSRWRTDGKSNENNARVNLIGGNKAANALTITPSSFGDALKAVKEGWPNQEPWQRIYTIREYTSREGKTTFDVIRAQHRVETGLESRDAAVEFAKKDYADKLKTKETGPAPDTIKVAAAQRTGVEHRAPGENVSSDRLKETFAFRGVNFGNWMKGETPAKVRERQLHLNHAFDAMMDLAGIAGVEPKALGLNGMLGLAVGAQGSGTAAAHFMPGVNEINLTRETGAGSLAHEWAHALDHYFAVQAGGAIARSDRPFMTNWSSDATQTAGIRPEIRTAFQKIINDARTRDMTPEEVAARERRGIEYYESQIGGRLKTIREALERTPNSEQALPEFDALAERLRDGDQGEGRMPTGRMVKGLKPRTKEAETVSQVGWQLMELLRANVPADRMDHTGPIMERLHSADAAAGALAYQKSSTEQRATHQPQTVPTEYMKNARALESKSAVKNNDPYWSSNWELFARAFQSYVIDKLAESNARSDYLSNPQMSEAATKKLIEAKLLEGDRYPRGAERTRLNEGFTTLLAALQTRTDTEGNVALFNSGYTDSAPNANEAHFAAIKAAVQPVTDSFGDNQPKLVIARTPEDLPEGVKKDPNYKRARGLYWPPTGTVYVIAPNNESANRARETYTHEAVGHFGVDQIIDQHVKGGWNRLTDDIERLRNDKSLGSADMRSAIASVESRYRNASPKTFAKELVAVMAERNLKNGLISRVIAAVKAFARKLFPSIKFSDTDIRALLQRSAEYLQGSETTTAATTEAAPAFSVPEETPTYYSALKRTVDEAKGAPKVANGQAWSQWLDGAQRRGEVKADERAWLGIDDWLKGQDKVSRQQISDYVAANEVQVSETVLGEGTAAQRLRAVRFDSLTADEQSRFPGYDYANPDEWAVYDNDSAVGLVEADTEADARYEAARLIGESGGNTGSDAKFAQYVLPGGDNYRELLLTLPGRDQANDLALSRYGKPYAELTEIQKAAVNVLKPADKPGYRSSHFDQPNIVAHVRYNERIDADGKKVLLVEEVQSDWHQAGRKQGYQTADLMIDGKTASQWQEIAAERFDREDVSGMQAASANARTLRDRARDSGFTDGRLVPDAPFKTTWPMLAMKRVLRHAAENGFDRVAWTTGEQQAARYDLSKQVDKVVIERFADGTFNVVAAKGAFEQMSQRAENADAIAGMIGKDLAEKANKQAPGSKQAYTGIELKVGGEGMKGFYDKILPNELAKYTKRWGAKPGTTQIVRPGEYNLLANYIKPTTDTVHSIDVTASMRDSVMEGQPLFSLPANDAQVGEQMDASAKTALKNVRQLISGKSQNLLPKALKAIQLTALVELMEQHPALKAAKEYDEARQQLSADRAALMAGAADAAENPDDMLKKGAANIHDELKALVFEKGPGGWFGKRRPEAQKMFDLMTDATQARVDFTKPYEAEQLIDGRGEPVPWTKETAKTQIDILMGQIRGRPGDDKGPMYDRIKHIRGYKKREAARRAAYPKLVARYQALPEAHQRSIVEQVAFYKQLDVAMQAASIDRVKAQKMEGKYERQLIEMINVKYAELRSNPFYVPLDRNGDHWISYTDKAGERGFEMFEDAAAVEAFERDLRASGGRVYAQGLKDGVSRARDAVPGTFMAEAMTLLRKGGAPESVQDEMHQLWLRTLPEASLRKRNIHRKMTPGYSRDGLRTFAKIGFHGAHQLSKLRYVPRMEAALETMTEAMDGFRMASNPDDTSETMHRDVARGDAYLSNLKERHDFNMKGEDVAIANTVNAIGFAVFIGGGVSGPLVNFTQMGVTTFPVLGSQYGFAKAGRMLMAAFRDSIRTNGNMLKVLKTEEDRLAYKTLNATGIFQRTRAHDLAGQAHGSKLTTNPLFTNFMKVWGYLFHKSEVVNRESTAMASFRMARAGAPGHPAMSFNDAIRFATSITDGTHLDYSAENRPQIMRGNTMRIVTQFKNYSIGMTWLMGRNLYKTVGLQVPPALRDKLKAGTPLTGTEKATVEAAKRTRNEARKMITAMMGMTSIIAGSMGLPIINLVSLVATAAHAAFGDDDDPWDFDTEFRAWLTSHFGELGGKIAADGPLNQLTGVNIASRASLSNLWLHDSDRDASGADAFHQFTDGLLGPAFGIAKNMFVGMEQAGRGNVERGVETMLPKGIKDPMKALRFASQGAQTLRGDPIVDDISPGQAFAQFLGFQPTVLAEQQKENSALMTYQKRIQDRRSSLLNGFAMALRLGEDRSLLMEKIHDFNQRYPEIAITSNTLKQSMKARARYSANAEGGVSLNKKLEATVREQAGLAR